MPRLRGGSGVNRTPVNANGARGGHLEAGEHHQAGRLARARRPEQGQKLALLDAEIDVVNNHRVPVIALADALKFNVGIVIGIHVGISSLGISGKNRLTSRVRQVSSKLKIPQMSMSFPFRSVSHRYILETAIVNVLPFSEESERMRYKRVVLKLSGGAVSGTLESGFDPNPSNTLPTKFSTSARVALKLAL